MVEVPDFIQRAIEAQGKTSVGEVQAALDDVDLEAPTKWEAAHHPEEVADVDQLELDTICATCNGRRQVWNERMGDYIRCPDCALPDPDKNRIGKFSDPAVSGAPETQLEAAIAIYPRTGTGRRLVLDAIARSGEHGCTDEELQGQLNMRVQTETPRRNELAEQGWIKDSGRRRRTSSGHEAAVWVLTDVGREQWSDSEA